MDNSERTRVIILLGAPGSGKGTQGKLLAEKEEFFHCSSGDMMRSLDSKSDLGKEFREVSSSGSLLPDDWTIRLWREKCDTWKKEGRLQKNQILILDGIPRNVMQAELMAEEIEVLHVLHFMCESQEELIKRIQKRMRDEGRKDDADEKVVEKRIQIYKEITQPLLDFYSSAVVDIDGSQEIEKVGKQIDIILN